MEVEPPQHFLGAGEHPLMLVAGRLWRGDRDQFDLVELVLADHAARILARRRRLRAEAWRQRREAQRQFGFGENGFADEVGQRDFGGRDEPEMSVDGAFSMLAREALVDRSPPFEMPLVRLDRLNAIASRTVSRRA